MNKLTLVFANLIIFLIIISLIIFNNISNKPTKLNVVQTVGVPPDPASPIPPAQSLLPVSPPDQISPTPTTYQEALELSDKYNKLVLVYFTAPSWCSPCQKMGKEILPNLDVQKVLKTFIFYKIDIDIKDRDIMEKWQLKAVPSYIIINSKEELIKSGFGYKTVNAFIPWLINLKEQ